jgi:tRNA A37 methylthiotransferase MiaB
MDRRVKVEQVREMIRMVKQHGMEAGTFIMLGYPGEEESDIKETLAHLRYSNPDHYTITVAYPIKGTPLYTEVEDIFIKDLPWETHTDRDIDFKRTYSKRYYKYAINWIQQEMLYAQSKKNIGKLKTRMRAIKARAGMLYERLRFKTAL